MLEVSRPPGGLTHPGPLDSRRGPAERRGLAGCGLVHGDDLYRTARERLPELARLDGRRIGLIAASEQVLEDVELLRRIAKRSELWIDIELLSPHRPLSRVLEPDAPSPEARLAVVSALREAGLRVGVRALPILPAINDALEEGVGALVDADLAKESARLQALQVKQQLSVQTLSIANSSPQILLGLFN